MVGMIVKFRVRENECLWNIAKAHIFVPSKDDIDMKKQQLI